jgi:hypothetical protein
MKAVVAIILAILFGFVCLEFSNDKYNSCLQTGMSAKACSDIAY